MPEAARFLHHRKLFVFRTAATPEKITVFHTAAAPEKITVFRTAAAPEKITVFYSAEASERPPKGPSEFHPLHPLYSAPKS